jgi:hypothetical protein
MAIIIKLAELGGTPQPIATVTPVPVPPQPEVLPPPIQREETKPAVVVPVAAEIPEAQPDSDSSPDLNAAAKPTIIAESPSQILARFQIPMKEGGSITADKLLDVQQRIWNWKKGIYRKKLGKFIATLITSQNTGKNRSIQEALQQSGLSLNEVQYWAKASQASGATAQSIPMELKTTPLAPAQVANPKTGAVDSLPVSLVEQKVPVLANPESVDVSMVKSAVPAGGTSDALSKLRIPLKDGGSVGAEQLLTVQERIWNWKGGSVRKQLGRFIAVLAASQGNEQAVQIAVKASGLSLNEVQYLLSKITSPTISSDE